VWKEAFTLGCDDLPGQLGLGDIERFGRAGSGFAGSRELVEELSLAGEYLSGPGLGSGLYISRG